MVVDVGLRISAQSAFLGLIHPEMRLIKIKCIERVIHLTVVFSSQPTEKAIEDVSVAATEIIADFPDAKKISENIIVSDGPLPVEDLLEEGWVYRRAE